VGEASNFQELVDLQWWNRSIMGLGPGVARVQDLICYVSSKINQTCCWTRRLGWIFEKASQYDMRSKTCSQCVMRDSTTWMTRRSGNTSSWTQAGEVQKSLAFTCKHIHCSWKALSCPRSISAKQFSWLTISFKWWKLEIYINLRTIRTKATLFGRKPSFKLIPFSVWSALKGHIGYFSWKKETIATFTMKLCSPRICRSKCSLRESNFPHLGNCREWPLPPQRPG
jgi:hypothetical protein